MSIPCGEFYKPSTPAVSIHVAFRAALLDGGIRNQILKRMIEICICDGKKPKKKTHILEQLKENFSCAENRKKRIHGKFAQFPMRRTVVLGTFHS